MGGIVLDGEPERRYPSGHESAFHHVGLWVGRACGSPVGWFDRGTEDGLNYHEILKGQPDFCLIEQNQDRQEENRALA